LNIPQEIIIGIAGIGFPFGIWLHGRISGKAKMAQNFKDFMENVTEYLGSCKDGLSNLGKSFNGCQNESAKNRATVNTKVEGFDKELTTLRLSTQAHAENRVIHTDQEWRTNAIDRMEKIATSIGERMSSLEQSVGGRLNSIESFMKNGKRKHED